MRRIRIAVFVWTVLGVVATSVPALAYPAPGITTHVSVVSEDTETGGGGQSTFPAISADGRHVAFSSFASNLVPGDTNNTQDVFVHDRETGTTERVSVASDGPQANHVSGRPAISGDGRYVAFFSLASSLVPGDTNRASDIFVHDRQTRITERVSLASDGTEGNGASSVPAISADGRTVAFHSFASNLVPLDANGEADVFVHNRQSGTTERVSVASDGVEANAASFSPAISADGAHVAFSSGASTLVEGDTNVVSDIFVHHRAAGTTQRVSQASDGTEGNGDSLAASISADGRLITFGSEASNLVPRDANGRRTDVFVHDREVGTTERVSVASDGTDPSGCSFTLACSLSGIISANGRYVAFSSLAANLVPSDANGKWDVFVHDRTTGSTERVSVGSDGSEGDEASQFPAISADGRHVAFESFASNFVPHSWNGQDIFVRDRGPTTGIGDLELENGTGEFILSGWARFAGATVAAAADPGDDGDPAGAEIVAASVTYRPEQQDLLLRLSLASLAEGGRDGVLYRWSFTSGETDYEVRAARSALTADPPTMDPYFALHECAPSCAEVVRLSGGFGTTGPEIRASVPLESLAAEENTALTSIEVSAALGEAMPGAVVVLDDVDLPDALIPLAAVGLGIASPSVPDDEVTFDTPADLTDGAFSGSLDASSLSAGNYNAWARACLGHECGATAVVVTVGAPTEQQDTSLELSVEGRGNQMMLRARLSVLDSPSTGIPDETIAFYSDGQLIGSAVTDQDGVATLAVPPAHRGANRDYAAVFAGDDFYSASSDEWLGQGGGPR